MKTIRVVSVDDEPLIRHAIRSLLNRHENIDLVGEGDSGDMVVRLVREHKPDILLLDLSMPEFGNAGMKSKFNTLSIIDELTELYPDTKIILLTGHQIPSSDLLRTVRSSAVFGYLLKSDKLSMHLHSAIESVYGGGMYYSETISNDMLNSGRNESNQDDIDLSDRQIEIIAAIYREPDLSSAELASKLDISESTFKTHLRRAYKSLGVTNKTAAVIKCMKLKLIDTVE